MSSVDNRIVEMQFNNKRFEENAKQSMSTLDKLKEKLNFKSAQKDMDDFQRSADSFNLSRMASAIEEIGNRFTMLGNLGQQTMQRIANAAIDAGVSLVKSISTDQISAGMSKYEEETNTVQTLLASLKPKGKTMQDIYEGLDKLAWYSDETSYSYTQMAGAVSNFVNAGQDFDQSIIAMQGIANVAAKAGVNIHDAQIAFRNFSDAMGKGHFELMDWRSIQNIHMDAEWFVQSMLDTAAELGKIIKDENGAYWIETGTGKNKKKQQIDTGNYRDFLKDDIFDREVIMKNMEMWANDAEAFAAAQNAKTFTDVMDAVKDSVSTSWKTTFRLIFGDVEEAIELFTPMANKIIEFTSAIGEFRNLILEKWNGAGGRESMIGALDDLWDTFNWFSEQFKFAVFDVFRPSYEEMERLGALDFGDYLGKRLAEMTKGIKDATQAFQDWLQGTNPASGYRRIGDLRNIFDGILSVVNIIKMVLDGVFAFVDEIWKQLEPTFSELLGFFGEIGSDLLGLNKNLKDQNGFKELAKNLAAIFEPLTSRLPKVIRWVRNLYNRVKDFWNNNKRFVTFRKTVENLLNSIIKFIPRAIDSIIEFGKRVFEMVKNSDEWKWLKKNYDRYIRPLVRWFSDVFVKVGQTLTDFFNMDTSDENTLWGKIKKRFSAFDKLGPWLTEKWEELKRTFPWLQDVEDWWNTDPVINEIKAWVGEISKALDIFLSEDTSGETSIVGKIKKRFEVMWDELGPWLEGKWNEYKEKYPILQQIEDTLRGLFGWGQTAEEAAQETEESTNKTVGLLQKVWDKITEFAGKIDPGKLILFGIAVKIMVDAYKKIRTLAGWANLGETISGVFEELGSTIKEARKSMKRSNMVQTVTALLGVALSIWLLGKTLMDVSQLSWPEIGRGLAAMAGLFVEEGAFMVIVNALSKSKTKSVHFGQMIGIGVGMYLLGKALKDVSELDWPEIGRGLAAMGGLFAETGVFTILANRFGKTGIFDKKGFNTTSILATAASMWLLGKALKNVSELSWPEIGRGLAAMGGLFAETGIFTVLVNRLGAVSIFKKGGLGSIKMLATAQMIKTLANTLKDLAGMGWDEIKKGLVTLGGLFLEEGAFMVLVNRLGSTKLTSKGGLSTMGVLSTAGSIMMLANTLKDVSSLEWDQIGRGLSAMAGLFVEEGAFMAIIGFLSKKKAIDPGAVNLTTGILANGIGTMGKAMAELGQLSLRQILKGALAIGAIEGLLGVFVGIMGEFETMSPKQAFGMVIVAGSMWLMAKAFEPLAKLSLKEIAKGVIALTSVALALGIFVKAMNYMQMSVKTSLGVIVSAISMAALMVAFAFAVSLIKDVDAGTILAFGAAMILVGGAMAALSAALQIFSNMSLGAALKGTAIMLIAATGLSAAVALILTITGGAIENFSNNIAVVGANLAQYADQVEGINMDAVNTSVTMIKDLSAAFVVVGARNYGNLETFKTNLTRMSSSLKIFGLNTADLNTWKMMAVTAALKQMAGDLSGFPEVSDVGTSIGNIGGALKLYSESLNGVNLDGAPDSTAIKTVFDTLKDAIPSDENLTEVAAYADKGKGDEMTNFAIGLTNIATAVSSFSESAKDLDFTNITKATEALSAIASLNTGLETTAIARFGPFAVELSEQKASLATFSEDIVALGTALNDFGTNVGKVNADDLTTGTTVLEKITEVNNALPATGGISQWITGTQSLTNFAANLRLLGQGAKAFGDAVAGSRYSSEEITAAGDALIKIAEVNQKLPQSGGISSWFTGDESLAGFGNSLEELGGGIAKFATAFGNTTVSNEMVKAISMISRIASIQVRLSDAKNWYSMNQLGKELNEAAGYYTEFNDKLNGVTTWADTSGFEHILSFAADQQTKLGSIEYKKSLKNIGEDLKNFFNEIWSFTKDWLGNDTGKLDKVTESVTGIFGALNEAFANANTDGSFTSAGLDIIKNLVEGIRSESSKTDITNAVQEGMKSAIDTIHPGNDTNFENAGTWIPAGVAKGIEKNQSSVINAVTAMANAAIKVYKEILGISSPSKVFAEMGMYSDQGLAQGLRNNIGIVEEAGRNVSQSAVGSVLNGMMQIQNLPLDQMEITPTIRPVLDTSDISSRAGMIDGLLGGTRDIGFNTRKLEAQAQILGETTAVDLGTITQRVTDLGVKLDEMSEAITNMKIVMNNGALVGAIATDIDRSIGARSRRAERGG